MNPFTNHFDTLSELCAESLKIFLSSFYSSIALTRRLRRRSFRRLKLCRNVKWLTGASRKERAPELNALLPTICLAWGILFSKVKTHPPWRTRTAKKRQTLLYLSPDLLKTFLDIIFAQRSLQKNSHYNKWKKRNKL